MDSSQILPDDKDLQVLCMWSQSAPHKSKMADSRHLEKLQNHHISTTV